MNKVEIIFFTFAGIVCTIGIICLIVDSVKSRAEIGMLKEERDAANALARQYERVSNICEQNMLEAEAANLKLERECNSWKASHDNQVKLKKIVSDRPDLKERAKLVAELIEERDGWREAAYSLGEAIPASWESLQPPAEQLRKFKVMVQLQNEKTKKLLDNADKHSKMYP